jgi:hypothetical protein
MDLASREKWDDTSRAKDEMFFYTDIVEHRGTRSKPIKLPPRSTADRYERPRRDQHAIVPDRF